VATHDVRSGTYLARVPAPGSFELMATRQGKRQFGSIRKLPSGRFQARCTGPDGHMYSARRRTGQPLTFETKGDANDWLSLRCSEILRNDWLTPAAPKAAPVTVREFAEAWLRPRCVHGRDPGRADGPARPLHAGSGAALSTRSSGPRSGDRCCTVRTRRWAGDSDRCGQSEEAGEDRRELEQHPSPRHRQALGPRALRRGDEPALRADGAARPHGGDPHPHPSGDLDACEADRVRPAPHNAFGIVRRSSDSC
jgi:hypothetical protein